MHLRRRGEAHVTSSRHSQSGGLGKRAGRSIKRTMQPRNGIPRRTLLAETGIAGGNSVIGRGSLESTAAKVGKVPRVVEALPHSEGAAYKRPGREVAACLWD